MSNQITQLVTRITRAIFAFQTATDAMDEACAQALGINRTDLRALSLLYVRRMSAGELAEALGLTRGAMTTGIDRLERAGFVRRLRTGEDRRSVQIEITGAALQKIGQLWGPLEREGKRRLARYGSGELKTILKFLDEGREAQEAQAARVRNMKNDT